MDSLFRYYVVAIASTRDEFVAGFPDLVLLKPPDPNATEPDDEDDSAKPIGVSFTDWNDTVTLEPHSPPTELREWRVARLRKAPGFQPYNRIVVGRSRVCDIVMPYPAISKIHAYFHITEGRPTCLSDRGSSNGTFVNARRLANGEVATVRPGDALRFGRTDLELLDAEQFYARLRAAGS